MFDDFDNLEALAVAPVTDWWSLNDYLESGSAGPLGRPISKLAFLIDDNAWPSHPGGFKRTNLLLHLLIGTLVFAISRALIGLVVAARARDWLALGVAALWLVHPLQVSTVMYVVQRMTQLASLFMLAGVAVHLAVRLRVVQLGARHLVVLTASLLLFTLLAALSKESGVLLPVYLLVIESTLLSGFKVDRALIWWRRLFLVLPTLTLIGYLAYLPRWSPSYWSRDFTLFERLLTEPVVLFDYLSHLFTLRVAGLGLLQDDVTVYSSLAQQPALAALLALVAALVVALAFRRRLPLLAFGILWFLAGHLLESTTPSLELYFEHRNYLALLGPVLACAVGLYLGLKRVSEHGTRLAAAVGLVVILIGGLVTRGYAAEWGAPERIYSIWAAEHPQSPRGQRALAGVFVALGDISTALQILDDGYARFPDDLAFPLASLDIACRFGGTPRYDLKDLRVRLGEHRWSEGLRPALRNLFENLLETPCLHMVADLHAMMPDLEGLPGLAYRRNVLAGLYVMDGNLYLRQKEGNRAMTAYRKADELFPSPGTALRIAGLYAQSGLHIPAHEALKVAFAREQAERRWYRPSRETQYREKLEEFDRLHGSSQDPAGIEEPASGASSRQ